MLPPGEQCTYGVVDYVEKSTKVGVVHNLYGRKLSTLGPPRLRPRKERDRRLGLRPRPRSICPIGLEEVK